MTVHTYNCINGVVVAVGKELTQILVQDLLNLTEMHTYTHTHTLGNS